MPAVRSSGPVLGLLGSLAAVTAALELTGSPLAPALVPACLALGSGATAVVAQRAASRLPGRSARPWRAIALATALLAFGQVLATVRSGAHLEFGGAEDVPMLLAVPVAVLAAMRLLPPRSRRWPGSRAVLDGAIATLAVALLGHVLLAALLAGVQGAADGLIAVGYPAVGAVLVGVGLVTVTAVRGARRTAAVWLLAASVAMAVVAVGGALGRTLGSTAATVVTEQAWLAMLAASVLAVRSDPGEPATPDHDRPIVPLRGLVLASGVASGVLLLLLAGALAGRPLDPVEAAGGAALVAITSLRTALWATDGYRLTRRLLRTEGYFRALVHSGDAVTLVLDGAGRIGWASGAVEAQLGWTDRELTGRLLAELLDDGDRDLVARVAQAVRGGTTVGLLPATVRLRTRDGSRRDVDVTGAASAGAAPAAVSGPGGRTGLVLHLRDVTDRSSSRRELERMAYTDFLTGLPNRARLMAALGEVWTAAAPGCLLLVDLDGFKAVNDVAGHDAGDRLLCEVAETLRSAAREDDVVARLGGDEFAVLVRAGREEATVLAERLVVLLDRDHRPPAPDGSARGGLVLPVSGSVGVAELRAGEDPAEAVRRADLALRAAKAAGKNCVRTTGEALDRVVDRRARLARDLPGAIVDGGLSLALQPVVGLEEGRVLGLEALVRWRHPDLGDVPPEEFVGVAEDEGLIVPLQRWVLAAATAALAPLLAEGHDLQLGVNVSVRHLQAGCLAADVTRALAASGVPASRLMLEITESVLVDAEDRVERELAALREAGCMISIDDFGTGHSTLARLARLPVDVLKMDRDFVAHIEDDPRTAAVVASVVELGRTLGLDVVAEGVETPGQLAVLRGLGCRFLQGYLLGRPVPAAELPAVLAAPRAGVLDDDRLPSQV
ncbi:putative bifunctional diguanylate cyclase/phosphodiesterase [Geodermatophilus poikilotrophus]|uniref:PAS domain S-box-containing protein/diguanylate cyclase (GGDEF) domain-containing protein n=1 Tax=Geodermatophilus poikilotrophus TaxID=1333667 RepID=A0A1I0FYW9_9ACTN|nr:GGDEF domain-containing phosphodiesterase [Geodermatophilus poikilotrophus]SET63762.1 PAS domain S-box-containing protein/diguanylate cyclase (GGDEF) domain-containing protein [Geodermatophilus poikilotrophus]